MASVKRNLLLGLSLAAALLVTLTAVLLHYGREETPTESEARRHDDSPMSAAPADDPATRRGSAPVGSEKRSSAPTEEDLPSAAPSTAGELIEVEIVRADDGEPVPHARVSWWPIAAPLSGTEEFRTWLSSNTVEAHESSAVRLQADRQGRVWVSDSDLGFVVVARTAELWGYASFGLDIKGPAQVRLAADLDVRVQVVDEQGRPVAGVPVALRERRGAAHTDHITARTDEPQGLAVLRHARPFLQRTAGSSPVFVVAVPGIFDPPVERPIDLQHSSPQILKLVLPPTGSCEVVVGDPSGEPILGEVRVHLRFAPRGSDSRPESAPPGETFLSGEGGRVLFEHVALGRDLVGAVTHHRALSSEEIRGPGPTRAGERVQLRAGLGSDLAIWRGRLLDPSGAALGSATAFARLEATDPDSQFEGTAGAWTVRTAEDGRFSVVTVPIAQRPERLVVAVYALSDRGVPVSVARVPAPADVGAGARELGDFLLRELPVVVEGEVVDARGEPVAGATVMPTLHVAADAPQPAVVRWPPRHNFMLTDRSGRFELRGEVPSVQIALAARKGGLTGEPLVVTTGARGVRLVLEPGGVIEGRVLLDPDVLDTPILVEVALVGPAPKVAVRPGEGPSRLGADGRFAVLGLAPGMYAVRIVHEATARELGTVSGVAVASGETTRDPRLDPLDLRRASRFVELTLVDEWGTPVPGARVFSRPSGDVQAGWLCTQAPGGRVKVLADARPLDVSIAASGFLTKELEGVDGAQRVMLSRAGQLRFQIAAGLSLPVPPLHLGIELMPLDAARPSQPGEWGPVRFDERGRASCEIPRTGRLQVQLCVQLDSDSSGSVRLLEGTPEVIEVAAGGGDQFVEIRFDPDHLAVAVRALKGQ